MKLSKYLWDKWLSIIIFIVSYFIILEMFYAFQIPKSLNIATGAVLFLMGICLIFVDYFRRKKFYEAFIYHTNVMDQKYLVLEMLDKPNFYEGEIIYQNLYEINKSMVERVSEYRQNIIDFEEYIEMWIHEVKIPIASLVLMCHNDKEEIDEKYIKQIRRLDSYADQVLYYMRSNNAENDYLIKETRLDKLVKNILVKNKDDLLENKIDVFVNVGKQRVVTDEKWIVFILNQIINNSIKYKKSGVDSVIKIEAEELEDSILFSIYDNGIGIPKKDIANVFKKTFTGENGRKGAKSTGMGLYIAKKLCAKLGHQIKIESEETAWTKITIIFGKNNYYRM